MQVVSRHHEPIRIQFLEQYFPEQFLHSWFESIHQLQQLRHHQEFCETRLRIPQGRQRLFVWQLGQDLKLHVQSGFAHLIGQVLLELVRQIFHRCQQQGSVKRL